MQIQLKQVEIVEALKAHITKQGFSLIDKTVEISFTAGRKDTGVSADISIEDNAVPGADEGTEEAAKPALSVVKALPNVVAAIATPETDKALAAPVAVAANDMAEKAPTSSLFGS